MGTRTIGDSRDKATHLLAFLKLPSQSLDTFLCFVQAIPQRPAPSAERQVAGYQGCNSDSHDCPTKCGSIPPNVVGHSLALRSSKTRKRISAISKHFFSVRST